MPILVNVVPGTCTFQLEIRDQDDAVMKEIETRLHTTLEEICQEQKMSAIHGIQFPTMHRPR